MTDIQAEVAGPAVAKTASTRSDISRERFSISPLFYLAPALVPLMVWTYIPLAEAFRLSFYQWNMLPTSPQRFVGLTNYQRLLALPEMRNALWNTLYYTIGLFPMSVIIPLFVAIWTQDLGGRARTIYRAMIFVPMIIAPVVAAILWRWLLNEDQGLITLTLEGLGLGRIGFLTDPAYALPTLTWITGWKLIGFSTLLFSAANAGINPSYIEAACIDGASRWRIICDIRLPLLADHPAAVDDDGAVRCAMELCLYQRADEWRAAEIHDQYFLPSLGIRFPYAFGRLEFGCRYDRLCRICSARSILHVADEEVRLL